MSLPSIKILLIEDNPGDVRLVLELFSEEPLGSYTLTHFTCLQETAVFIVGGGIVDIILLDMNLPDASGLDTLTRIREIAPGVPVLVLTGIDDDLLASQTMQSGAQDYFVKGQAESRALPRALRHSIERHRMQAENDRLRDEQIRLRDHFLSHVSHELRSPLASILSFTSILADGLGGDTTTQQDEYLHIILNNVEQLQAMIEDLLEASRSVSGRLSVDARCFPIAEPITFAIESLREIARYKQIEIIGVTADSPLAPPLPIVYADPMRIRQVLNILMDNAIKFTPPGGEIRVTAKIALEDPDAVQVCVTDKGCGIPAEERELVFRHLYQVSNSTEIARKGLGVGLHIARQLVTQMGGRIWVTSAPEEGSCFSFTIPIFPFETFNRSDEPQLCSVASR